MLIKIPKFLRNCFLPFLPSLPTPSTPISFLSLSSLSSCTLASSKSQFRVEQRNATGTGYKDTQMPTATSEVQQHQLFSPSETLQIKHGLTYKNNHTSNQLTTHQTYKQTTNYNKLTI